MDLTGPDFSQARYWTEFDETGERLVMPIRRSWKVVGWALFGFAAFAAQHIMQIGENPDWLDLLLAAFLIGGALHLVLNILTSLLAREVLRTDGRDLIHGWRLLWLRREKRYPMSEIHALSADREVSLPKDDQLLSPLKDFGKVGVVNFDFRGETVGIGAALDNAHGQQVVRWLARRLPRNAVKC